MRTIYIHGYPWHRIENLRLSTIGVCLDGRKEEDLDLDFYNLNLMFGSYVKL